jgi:putative NIF3 family GTP cyclohydrolase 1 type 2
MNANDLREHFLSRSPWVNREETVDRIIAGDPTREIRTVGVGWMSALDNLRAAHELGCELFITHEPTFWEHTKEQYWRTREPGITKQRFLDETGLLILRVHDCWDKWPEIGIRPSWAEALGLTKEVAQDESGFRAIYEIDPQTLREFARSIAQKVKPVGQDSVQVMGAPDMVISRPALGVGCIVPDMEMVERGSDCLVLCFDSGSYWAQRERLYEAGVGVITVEHGTTEVYGMRNLATYLQETFPELTVRYLEHHPKPWTVSIRT